MVRLNEAWKIKKKKKVREGGFEISSFAKGVGHINLTPK